MWSANFDMMSVRHMPVRDMSQFAIVGSPCACARRRACTLWQAHSLQWARRCHMAKQTMANWLIWRTDYGKLALANGHMTNRFRAKRHIPANFILYLILYISIYKNGCTNVCLFVCLLVCGELMEIQTTAPILMKFSTHIPTCPRKVLV